MLASFKFVAILIAAAAVVAPALCTPLSDPGSPLAARNPEPKHKKNPEISKIV
ncbi:hypothetical protein V8E53_009135 [Lactarius tabidus]